MFILNTLIASSLFPDGFTSPTTRFNEDADKSPVVNVVQFLSSLIGFLTVLGAIFFIVQLILAAFKWLTAGGDSGQVEKARNQIIQAVLGLVIIVLSYGLIELVGSLLGLDLINLQETIENIIVWE